MTYSICDYFDHLTDNVPWEQKQIVIDNVVIQIVNALLIKSRPMIKVSQDVSLISCGAIILPRSLQLRVDRPIIEEALRRATQWSNVRVEFSSYVDSIVCYQVSAGNSIWELAEFDLW